ncbi:glycoside hydrolase [Cupriavidus sp. USMAA2-4]|uniref:glycoside hydrolase family 24 protein n=1 Tax=Cupriavidus sp. USMAA2-4 TaxID=876364 RepID=UPI0008A6A726|nr:glycoside hydrolase family 104 protein [Cupriavidus sp. USMAA2-4]AOY90399.1 glycoside hydrolase [Cupriavidus sp. USMAA2-4]AOY93845.1 glycoside hydrolase [Cupriavidus sp. USMAA2-4]
MPGDMDTPNIRPFLDMIAVAELGRALIAKSDNGYNVLVGSTPAAPKLFRSYADHPRQLVLIRAGLSSTAAGRYQVLARWYDIYRRQLGLTDFGPVAQDRIAVQQIRERLALQLITAGRFDEAVSRVRNIWASLPGAGYGQNEHSLDYLRGIYLQAGGVLA